MKVLFSIVAPLNWVDNFATNCYFLTAALATTSSSSANPECYELCANYVVSNTIILSFYLIRTYVITYSMYVYFRDVPTLTGTPAAVFVT